MHLPKPWSQGLAPWSAPLSAVQLSGLDAESLRGVGTDVLIFSLSLSQPYRCFEPPEPAGHLRHPQSSPASGRVR